MRNPTIVTLILCLIFSSLLFAQSGNIEGIITDQATGEFLAGANVFLKGTAIGAATDLQGSFRVSNVPPGQYILVVSYIGYEQKESNVTISPRATLKVEIKLH